MKLLTLNEAESTLRKAVEFHRIGQDDQAERFEAMSPEQLEAELDKANDYIEELECRLDSIAGIATDSDETEDADDKATKTRSD